MRWQGRKRSSNVEDRRGRSVRGSGGGSVSPLLQLLPRLLGRRGGKWIFVIVIVVMGLSYLGVDIPFITGPSTLSSGSSEPYQPTAEENQLAEFVSVVLADTEETWTQIFASQGTTYVEPKLVMFTGAVRSACGAAQAAMGPFYCPADQKVYIDLSFYRDLKNRHGAPGDFAQAYVIAHEVGHHIQTLDGTSRRVHAAKSKVGKAQANALSVRQELQADCLAGVWGNKAKSMRNLLEPGDLEEALTAASAIGDDRLQKQARGQVNQESFTHGSSEQRVRWFKRGFTSGDFRDCDTFSAQSL